MGENTFNPEQNPYLIQLRKEAQEGKIGGSDDKARSSAVLPKEELSEEDGRKILDLSRESEKAAFKDSPREDFDIEKYIDKLNQDLRAYINRESSLSEESREWFQQSILSGDYRDIIYFLKDRQDARDLIVRVEDKRFQEALNNLRREVFNKDSHLLDNN